MRDGDTRFEVWEEEDQDFGAGDGAISRRGTLWNVDEHGNKGDVEVGESERTDRPTPHGSAGVTLILRLNDAMFPPGTIVAKGALPHADGKIGSGLLAITGGTGGHAALRGVIRVESWNPKKYVVEGGG